MFIRRAQRSATRAAWFTGAARCAVVILCGLGGACGPRTVTSVEELRSTEITLPDGKKIVAETMRDQGDLMRGMMFRDSLAEDRGMLFVHVQPGNYPYWMFRVRIALDILWLDHGRRIVEISANTPPCPRGAPKECPSYGGHEKAQYVLELASGVAAKHRLRVGDVLSF